MNNEQKVYSQEQLNPEDVGQKEHERDRAREAKTSMGRAVPPSDDADNGAPANGKALDADGNAGSDKSCAIGGERERFIPSHNIVKICSQNHCALQFVRLEEQHGHN